MSFLTIHTACVKSHRPAGEGGGVVSEERSSICVGGGLASWEISSENSP